MNKVRKAWWGSSIDYLHGRACHPLCSSSSNSNIFQRSTSARMGETSRRLYEQEGAVELGNMERTYHAHSLSKQLMPPPGNNFDLPNDNTSRQTRHLDNVARQVHEKKKADEIEGLEDDEFVPIRVKVDLEARSKCQDRTWQKSFICLQGSIFLPSTFLVNIMQERDQLPDTPKEKYP